MNQLILDFVNRVDQSDSYRCVDPVSFGQRESSAAAISRPLKRLVRNNFIYI